MFLVYSYENIIVWVRYRPCHNVKHVLQRAFWKKALKASFYFLPMKAARGNMLQKIKNLHCDMREQKYNHKRFDFVSRFMFITGHMQCDNSLQPKYVQVL